MQEGGLEAFDVENLRRHYARTLRLWSDNYEASSAKLRQLVDEEKFRIGSNCALPRSAPGFRMSGCMRRAGEYCFMIPDDPFAQITPLFSG